MKKVITLFTVLYCLNISKSIAQADTAQSISHHQPDADLLFLKARTQKTVAWILLGGGTAMIIGSAISYPQRKSSSLSDAFAFNANDIIILIGTGVDLISIPFFVSAYKNKKRAAKIAITGQKILWYQKNSAGFVMQSSVAIRIGL